MWALSSRVCSQLLSSCYAAYAAGNVCVSVKRRYAEWVVMEPNVVRRVENTIEHANQDAVLKSTLEEVIAPSHLQHILINRHPAYRLHLRGCHLDDGFAQD
jgi:hypothetical protein